MSTSGTRNTSNVAGRMYDVADVVSLLDTTRYPMLGILTNAGKDPVSKKGNAMKKKETVDPEFKWFEDTFGSREMTTATGQTGKNIAAASTLVVVAGQGVRAAVGDIVRLVTLGHTFRVTAVSTDTLSLTAELGGATGTLDLSSLPLWIVGNANQEGAGLREIKGTTAVEKTGYCQIFRTPFGVTNTSKSTKTFIKENDFDYQRRKKGIEHMVDIERAFLFGKKSKDSSGTHPLRTTDGVLSLIATNATASVDTEAEFLEFLETAFASGNTEKYAFCGPAFVSQINVWAQNKLQIMQGEQTYGLTILRYVSAHGTLNIIKHDLLKGATFGNYCVVLDMENVNYRYLSGRDTKLYTNRQANDVDGQVDEYLSEVGLQFELEQTHAIASKGAL